MYLRRYFLLVLLAIVTATSSWTLWAVAGDDDDRGRSAATSLDEVPDAVKATMLIEILREVDGLKLEELERESENGKTVYEAEFECKGKDIELEIASNGQLLAKLVERDDDEDDEDDD